MNPRLVHLLSISYDSNLIEQRMSDALDRHRIYAKEFASYTVLVLSQAKTSASFSDRNLHIYSCHSKFKPWIIIKALLLAYKLHRKRHFDVITADDPMFTGLFGNLLKHLLRIPLNLQLHIDYYFSSSWLKERALGLFRVTKTA